MVNVKSTYDVEKRGEMKEMTQRQFKISEMLITNKDLVHLYFSHMHIWVSPANLSKGLELMFSKSPETFRFF